MSWKTWWVLLSTHLSLRRLTSKVMAPILQTNWSSLSNSRYAVLDLPAFCFNSTVQYNHGLSRRRDRSHYHEWDLLCARSPIREWHIRWQIWHSKLLVVGGPDLCRSRLDSSSSMRCVSNFSTADLHEERQSALSIASASDSEGAMPQRFSVDLRQS